MNDEPNTGQLQDFACRVSDMLWGGELGWTQGKDGLDRLFAALKDKCKRADAALDIEHRRLDAEAERDNLRDMVVYGFYEEKEPSYHQGRAGEHEITEPVTARECNGLIKTIATLKAQVAGLLEALKECGRYFAEHDRDEEDAAMLALVCQALAAFPSTRTAALLRAGEAALKETRAEREYADHSRKDSQSWPDYESWVNRRQALFEATCRGREARRVACATVPDTERNDG